MIVREQTDRYVLIHQHDHAKLSGTLATCWGNESIPAPPPPNAGLMLATALHDVGWMPLDHHPRWNEAEGRPFSFVDEPLERKLPAYVAGVDRVSAEDAYAGLLCSRHYTSFFPPEAVRRLGDQAAQYVAGERARQKQLQRSLREVGRQPELARADFDLALLKLWDNLSLYVALNEPGTSKEREHPWYRDGFSLTHQDWAAFQGDQEEGRSSGGGAIRFQACWIDQGRVALRPFPLRKPVALCLRYQAVEKASIESLGFAAACSQAPPEVLVVRIVPQPDGV